MWDYDVTYEIGPNNFETVICDTLIEAEQEAMKIAKQGYSPTIEKFEPED